MNRDSLVVRIRCGALLWLALLLGLLGIPVGLAAGMGPPDDRWRADSRFTTLVSAHRNDRTMWQLLASMGKRLGFALSDPDTHVDDPPTPPTNGTIEVQLHLGYHPVSAQFSDVPAGEVLDAIATATNGTWEHIGSTWVLAENRNLAKLLAMSPEEVGAVMDRAMKQWARLSGRQALLIHNRGWLSTRDLTPIQFQGLVTYCQANYARGDDHAVDSAALARCYLKLEAKKNPRSGRAVECVSLYVPNSAGVVRVNTAVWREPVPPGASMAIYDRPVPTPPVVLGPFPGFPARGAPVDLEAELALSRRLLFTSSTASAAVEQVMAQTGQPMIFSSPLDIEGVQTPKPEATAAEILTVVSDSIGGRWRKAGRILTYQPHPALERISKLDADVRDAMKQTAISTVHRGLVDKRRERLRELGAMTSTELSPIQKNALQWLAAVSFISDPGLNPTTLDLQGVTLRLKRPTSEEARKGAPATVQYLFATLSGEPREVANVPLR